MSTETNYKETAIKIIEASKDYKVLELYRKEEAGVFKETWKHSLLCSNLARVGLVIENFCKRTGVDREESYDYIYIASVLTNYKLGEGVQRKLEKGTDHYLNEEPNLTKKDLKMAMDALEDGILSKLRMLATMIGDNDLTNQVLDIGDLSDVEEQMRVVEFFEDTFNNVKIN